MTEQFAMSDVNRAIDHQSDRQSPISHRPGELTSDSNRVS